MTTAGLLLRAACKPRAEPGSLWQGAHVARFIQPLLHVALQECDLRVPAAVDVTGSHCVSTNKGATI